MKHQFKMQLIDGNPVIEHNSRHFLVDTGNPTTLANESIKDFCGREWPAQRHFMGTSLDSISEMVGQIIDGMIGLDLMRNFVVTFDYSNGMITFGDKADDGLEYVPISTDFGVIAEMELEGQTKKCIIDSGARLSYLMGEVPENAVPSGRMSDYHPLNGHFETDVYEATATLAGHLFIMKFGQLPRMLEMALGLARVKAIVGHDLLSQYRVTLDFLHNKMALN